MGELCSDVHAYSRIIRAMNSFIVYHIFFSPASRSVYPLRVPSSVHQPSAITLSKYLFYSTRTCSSCLCHLYPAPSRNSFCFFVIRLVFFFRSSYFLGGVFSLCSRARYACTWFAYELLLSTAATVACCKWRMCVPMAAVCPLLCSMHTIPDWWVWLIHFL